MPYIKKIKFLYSDNINSDYYPNQLNFIKEERYNEEDLITAVISDYKGNTVRVDLMYKESIVSKYVLCVYALGKLPSQNRLLYMDTFKFAYWKAFKVQIRDQTPSDFPLETHKEMMLRLGFQEIEKAYENKLFNKPNVKDVIKEPS